MTGDLYHCGECELVYEERDVVLIADALRCEVCLSRVSIVEPAVTP